MLSQQQKGGGEGAAPATARMIDSETLSRVSPHLEGRLTSLKNQLFKPLQELRNCDRAVCSLIA